VYFRLSFLCNWLLRTCGAKLDTVGAARPGCFSIPSDENAVCPAVIAGSGGFIN
jgi:hypothetical protein